MAAPRRPSRRLLLLLMFLVLLLLLLLLLLLQPEESVRRWCCLRAGSGAAACGLCKALCSRCLAAWERLESRRLLDEQNWLQLCRIHEKAR